MAANQIVNPAWVEEIEPTHTGPAARAWKCEWELDDDESRAREELDCGGWILHAPGSHPFWTWYLLMGTSLRETPTLPPSFRHFPGATHELIVLALHPEHEPPRPTGKFSERGRLVYLMPPDQCHQTMHVTDEQFTEMVGLFAKAVAEGYLVPDQDHRQAWAESMAQTTDHYRGLHG